MLNQLRKDIIEAYAFLRKNDQSIPSDSLDFMKQKSIESLDRMENKDEKYTMDYWAKEIDKCESIGDFRATGIQMVFFMKDNDILNK